MPEARDRLLREEDPVEAYSRRRFSRPSGRDAGRVGPILFVLEDGDGDIEGGSAAGGRGRWRDTPLVSTPLRMGVTGRGRSVLGAPRVWRTPQITGRENLSPLGRGVRSSRGRGSVLPSWYPRRPLNDITAVVRVMERRRERRQRIGEGQQREGGPTLQDRTLHDSPAPASRAPLEHNDVSMTTPCQSVISKRCPMSINKVQKILLDIAHGDSSCLTPQKKLLNNIDRVEKVVMEELSKLKRTPSAKKAEREKKVRTLMLMR
ncbi:protein POLYCHOME [Andrographis paniculata]|uniref:protein POLYCHOME n=1 Tax=Andrographis paniculata TaxID=175694 RepID=UPI0021E741F8|nr:protein POLYCHOME [Andrographis paniculata]